MGKFNYDEDWGLTSQNQFRPQMELSLVTNQRKIFINEDITEDSVFKYMYYLDKLVDLDNQRGGIKQPIELCINTNGGSVYDCFTLISKIEYMKDNGYHIITTNIGRAFSAGFLISICGSERRAYRLARYMYHDVSSGTFGKYYEMKESLEEVKILSEMISDIVCKYTNLTRENLQDINKYKLDRYYSASEILDLKGVDIIL